jgi:hypothetical protein
MVISGTEENQTRDNAGLLMIQNGFPANMSRLGIYVGGEREDKQGWIQFP